jgi:transmembrane sensor
MDATDRRKRASEEATEWLVALQGDAPHALREQFIDWLRESPLHVAQMLRVAQVHGALEQFERWARIPTAGSDDDDMIVDLPTARSPSSDEDESAATRSSLTFAWPVAAVLAVCAIVVAILFPAWYGQVIQTERAERREVALTDGSVAQLDPETRLRVKYEDHVRRVFLERGRALFHVAKNKDRPFLVRARDTTVRAVGTAFAVEQQASSVLVTVAEGKVEVIPTLVLRNGSGSDVSTDTDPSAQEDAKNSSWPGRHRDHAVTQQTGSSVNSSGSRRQIFLTADEQIVVDESGSANAIRNIDSGRVLAWAQGRLIFDYTSLGEAIRQFNRYNSIRLALNDPALAEQPISGVFNASDPESFVAFIQSVSRVRVRRSSSAYILIEPAK